MYLLVLTASARPCCFYLFLPTEPAPAPIPSSLTYGPCLNHRRYAALGKALRWLLAAARIGSYEVPAACTSTIADLSRNLGLSLSSPFLALLAAVTTGASVAFLHRPSLFIWPFQSPCPRLPDARFSAFSL